MPAKKRIPKEAIAAAALSLFRTEGMEAVNTARLSAVLGCSTQPLYHAYKNMEELKADVRVAVLSLYEHYLQEEGESGKWPPYKAQGMGYIRFAREEPQAFRYLFMSGVTGYQDDAALQNIADTYTAGNVDFHTQMWFFVHGIACMQATGYLPLDDETVSTLLTAQFKAMKGEKT